MNKIDKADVCELSHLYTENECVLRGIELERMNGEELEYSPEAQEIFDKHYKLITETLCV